MPGTCKKPARAARFLASLDDEAVGLDIPPNVAVAAHCRRDDGIAEDERYPDATLQLDAHPFRRQIQSGDPAIEGVGLYAEPAGEPMRSAEYPGGVEGRVDEIRHGAYVIPSPHARK